MPGLSDYLGGTAALDYHASKIVLQYSVVYCILIITRVILRTTIRLLVVFSVCPWNMSVLLAVRGKIDLIAHKTAKQRSSRGLFLHRTLTLSFYGAAHSSNYGSFQLQYGTVPYCTTGSMCQREEVNNSNKTPTPTPTLLPITFNPKQHFKKLTVKQNKLQPCQK